MLSGWVWFLGREICGALCPLPLPAVCAAAIVATAKQTLTAILDFVKEIRLLSISRNGCQ